LSQALFEFSKIMQNRLCLQDVCKRVVASLARPKDLTMRFPALFSLLLLANCATQSPLEPPVVDQRGHDPIPFQNDQLECIERGKGFMGGSITACMRERGYTILVPKN